MTTELYTEMKDHSTTMFWGGEDKGMCLQITANSPIKIRDTVINQLQEEGFIHTTMEEAAKLLKTLNEFIYTEAIRRQNLLKEQIRNLQDIEKTVFNEIANLPTEYFKGPDIAIDFVSMYCPKTKLSK